MKIEMMPVSSISFDSENARTHPPENRAMLRASLERFGQRKPIVVSADNVVIAGNGTLLAALELGWKKIAAVRAPEDWTETEIRAFAIADNRSTDLSVFDNDVLRQQLAALEIAEFEFEALGFNEAELAKLGNVDQAQIVTALDPMAEWTGMPDYDQPDATSKFSCTVHFQSEEDWHKFFELLGTKPYKSFWWPESDGLVGSTQHEQYVVADEA